MRIRSAVILIVVSLVSAVTISITGQEEALPVVHATDGGDAAASDSVSYASLRPEPTLYLAVEPIRELPPVTIAQAARNNDWLTFHDLYVRAQNRGEDVSQFQSLHELWSWSLSDPIGAFYGRDIHDRLARAYPGFSTYISEYVLVDRRGNTFYPTAETRTFLLARATRGEVPRVMIAEATEEDPQRALPKVSAKSLAAATPVVAPRVAAAAPGRRSPTKPATQPTTSVAEVATPIAPPIVTAPPIVATPPIETKPQPILAEEPKVAATPAPVPARAQQPAAEIATDSNDLRNRGILLLIIGLLGIGILAVILRAPKEEPRPYVDLSDKVHPIRKASADDQHRATGSHG